MDFEDDAFVLSARAHGETGAIVELLTAEHGKWAAHVAGGASRRMKPILQSGARVGLAYRSRTDDQLGSARLEATGEGPDGLFDDALALAGLASAAAVVAGSLSEREPQPEVFAAFEALRIALDSSEIWPAVMVRFEAGLLQALGFGLDLSRCAVTGATDDLAFVSPRTGRAVSRAGAGALADRLLQLPLFLLSSQERVQPGDVGKGLDLTGAFLARFIFAPMNRPLPPARVWLVDRLRDARRL